MKKLLINVRVLWCIFYILSYHKLFGMSTKTQATEDTSYLMQIGSRYVHGLQFDFSLCRIFQPTLEKSAVTFDRKGTFPATKLNRIGKRYYITRMKPLITKSPHYDRGLSPVRFILLNRCNPLDRRSANLLDAWSKKHGATECQSQEFFKVLVSLIIF